MEASVEAIPVLGHESSFTTEKLFDVENSNVTTMILKNVVELVTVIHCRDGTGNRRTAHCYHPRWEDQDICYFDHLL